MFEKTTTLTWCLSFQRVWDFWFLSQGVWTYWHLWLVSLFTLWELQQVKLCPKGIGGAPEDWDAWKGIHTPNVKLMCLFAECVPLLTTGIVIVRASAQLPSWFCKPNVEVHKRATETAEDRGYLCKRQESVGDTVSSELCKRLQQGGLCFSYGTQSHRNIGSIATGVHEQPVCNGSNSLHGAGCLSLIEPVSYPGEDIKGSESLACFISFVAALAA